MIVNDTTINKGTNDIFQAIKDHCMVTLTINKNPNFLIKIENDRDKMLNDLDD